MSLLDYDIPGGRTKYEPQPHAAFAKGFVGLPSAGFRPSPEELVLELFRELFFDDFAPQARAEKLMPDTRDDSGAYLLTSGERAVLGTMRVRKRLSGSRKAHDYYAPAFPCLAAYGWRRKQSDRVVRDFLLCGAMAQHYHGSGRNTTEEVAEAAATIVGALIGSNSASPTNSRGAEILSVPLRESTTPRNAQGATDALCDHINATRRVFRTPRETDPLAATISGDFVALCRAESGIPRIQWLGLVMAFMRIATPVYMLAHMRLTVWLRDKVFDALENGDTCDDEAVMSGIYNRRAGLLHPTLTPSREVFQHVDEYMRARVELSVLLHLLQYLDPSALNDETTIVSVDAGAGRITIAQLLGLFARQRDEFVSQSEGLRPRQVVTRKAEDWGAWKDPRTKGQGKNYDEFLRVLYRAEEGDVGGSYLLTDNRKRRASRGFAVFPGPLLTTTFVMLADMRKKRENERGRGGKLILADVEDHFRRYGIDFSTVAGARPQLLKLLLDNGLLKGSPDAGDSVEIVCPY